MEGNYISKISVFGIVMFLLLLFFTTPILAADSYFEKGKKYHIEYLGIEGDFLVLSEPDDFGWIKVKNLPGSKLTQYIGDEGLVNIKTAIMAKEIK